MRKMMVIIGLISFMQGQAQKAASVDDLQKYSYLLYGENYKGDIAIGTAFFIKINGVLNIVTAKHCVTGWDNELQDFNPDYPEVLRIRVVDKEGQMAPINFRTMKHRAAAKKKQDWESPDVIIIPISEDPELITNVINDFIDPSTYRRDPDEIIFFGFDLARARDSMFTSTKVTSQLLSSLNQNIKSTGPNYFIDSLNYLFKGSGPTHGTSGAPVFFRYRGSDRFYFGGVNIGGRIEVSDFKRVAVRPEYLFK